MKHYKLIIFSLVVTMVFFSFTGCSDFLSQFPNIVTVRFSTNGGEWLDGGTKTVERGGTEGEHYTLPTPPRYIEDVEYNGSSHTTITYKEFLGWTLAGEKTLIYNNYDTKGAFPQEDKAYAAKWGTSLTRREDGDTTENYN